MLFQQNDHVEFKITEISDYRKQDGTIKIEVG